ncbi:MAG: hypothetical protein M0C28_18635 [Candidatus Moduliflexus flocculans]|nr:hypothetical protein [Candidatus Moduliflexus flocculans]
MIDELVVNDTLGSVIVKPMPAERNHPACLGRGRCADVLSRLPRADGRSSAPSR